MKSKKPKKADAKPWVCSQISRNVFRLNVNVVKNLNWEWWFLLTSDQHWDNPKSNHELQIKHLEQARERNAAVMSAGDFFCLMQGRYDKRSNKSSLRPEHKVDNYLDAVINTAADFFTPYADLFTVIATGNHEASIAERYETNMIDRFCGVINNKTKAHIHNGGFSGWIIFSFDQELSTGQVLHGKGTRVVLHYDHGYGGGGPVTADMIQHQRRAVYLPDADIILSGHTHDQWVREFARVRLTSNGAIRHDIQTHIKIPSYKDDRGDGYGGWATATKGMPPKPIGAWWLRFYFEPKAGRVLYETIPAK